MLNSLWLPATIFGATFQVARNALQRGLMGAAGPWGATLVRFLFGLPFSLLFVAVATAVTPAARPHFGAAFWAAVLSGALSQVLATAALLVAMRRAGFAVATALQQSSLPLSAIIGLLVFHDRLGAQGWIGVAITSLGVAALTWPWRADGAAPAWGGAFALLSGLLFGYGLNAFRHASLSLDASHPIYCAFVSLCVAQTAQALGLSLWLAWRDPASLRAVAAGWRESLAAGLCGALASAGWFVALALVPAAPVRAVGVIETPIAAIAGRRIFRERLQLRQFVAGGAVLVGVVLTARA